MVSSLLLASFLVVQGAEGAKVSQNSPPPDQAQAPAAPPPVGATADEEAPGAEGGKKKKKKKKNGGDEGASATQSDPNAQTAGGNAAASGEAAAGSNGVNLATPGLPEDQVDEEPTDVKNESGNDAFGKGAGLGTTMFNFRLLTQIRYKNTSVDDGSLVRAGDPDPFDRDAYTRYGKPDVGKIMPLPPPAKLTTMDAPARRTEQLGTMQEDDGYRAHRVFLRIEATPSKRVRGKLLADFSELLRNNPKGALKLAYAEMEPNKRFQFTVGYFKRSFSLLELLPIADFELAEVGPTDEFIKDMGFAGRDTGVMFRLRPLPSKKLLSLFLGTYAGDVTEGYNASPVKLVTARAELRPTKNFRFGADAAWRPYQNREYKNVRQNNGSDTFLVVELDKGQAYSGDVTFSYDGLEIRAEGIYGSRTDKLNNWSTNAYHDPGDTFLAAWAIASYRIPFWNKYALMPALRAEYLDTDREDAKIGEHYYYTAGVNLEFPGGIRLLVDLSRYTAQFGTRAFSNIPWQNSRFNYRPWDTNWTQFIVQLQYVM